MARAKQVARVSTGGSAPRKQWAKRAARKSPRNPPKEVLRIVEVRYRPYRGADNFEAVREGETREEVVQLSLSDWKDCVRGFLVAYKGPQGSNHNGWVPVSDLYGMTNCELDKGSSSAVGVGEGGGPVICDNLMAWSQQGYDGIYISACDNQGQNSYPVNLLTSSYRESDGMDQKCFADALSVVSSKAYYSGFLHALAKEQYSEYKELVGKLEATPHYRAGNYASVYQPTALGSRVPSRGTPAVHLLPSSVFGVSFTRKAHGVNCLVGACANAVGRYNYLHGRAVVSTVSKYFPATKFRKLKEMNQVLSSSHIRQAAKDWVQYLVMKAPLPAELLRPPYDEAKRMEWVLGYRGEKPLLVTLVNQAGSEKHAVSIVNHAGRMLVLDSEETFGLKLSKEALSYCCGTGEVIKGLGSVMQLGIRPARDEESAAKPSSRSGSPEKKKHKKDSGAGSSTKPRPSTGGGGGEPKSGSKSKSPAGSTSQKSATVSREHRAKKKVVEQPSSRRGSPQEGAPRGSSSKPSDAASSKKSHPPKRNWGFHK